MSARIGGVAAGIYGAYKVYQWATTSNHDRLLKRTFSEAKAASSSNATILIDHMDPRGSDGTPRNYNGYRPDLVLTDFNSPNIIVEVETETSLNFKAKEQLKAFKKSGYTRILIVPTCAKKEAKEFVSTVPGLVRVMTPSELGPYLQ